VSAPFLARGIWQDTHSYHVQLWTDETRALNQHFGLSIKPRAAVYASRPRWRGTKDPVYLWRFDLKPDSAMISHPCSWLSDNIVLDPADVAAAEALAAEIGMDIGKQALPLAA
jgi:predicted DNA-binding transcriptional regulator YafY